MGVIFTAKARGRKGARLSMFSAELCVFVPLRLIAFSYISFRKLPVMIKSPTTLLLSFSLIMAVACGGDDDDDKLKFEGILLTDETNNPLGTKGSRDLNDWQNEGKLDKKIMNLLDFEHDEDVSGTVKADVEIDAYPNPVSDEAVISFFLTDYSLVKIILVNEELEVLDKISFVEHQDATVHFGLKNTEKYPDQKIIRAYYSISSEADDNYYVGHGDIWICRSECN